ncbi:complement factor B-2 [Apostichopus japonicus]|uniref:Complement factor B-2 n=1 Tax=Stichopus japonicus TaxID=307972 RepID=A0A2G8LDG9_STIJA|nr:complement factor B-2 [Apostichopus japonicus]
MRLIQLNTRTLPSGTNLATSRRDECETSLVGNDEEDWFDETMTCAGYLGREVGPCSGDSGGPLVKYAKRGDSRRWTVIGVTSWTIGCALQNELDFFANAHTLFLGLMKISTRKQRG